MNIGIIYQGEFPPAERIEKEAATLQRAGHKVFVLCNAYVPSQSGAEEFEGSAIQRVRPIFRSRRANKIVKFPLFANPLWLWQIYSFARRHHLDVLQVVDIPLSLAVIAVGRVLGIPVLLDMWENYPEALRGWGELDWKKRITKNHHVARAVERIAVRLADQIVVVVDEQKERLAAEGIPPGKITVVSNTVALEQFLSFEIDQPNVMENEPGTFKILYVGAVTVERGLDDIVRALKLLRSEIPYIRLYIAGNGPYLATLRALAEELKVGDLVRFVGWVGFKDIPSYISKSDLCLVPHKNNAFINTTIPNKIFQYMALAKPLLVSDAGPLKRIVRSAECGFVFRSEDPADAAVKILQAANSRELAVLGKNGERAVRERYNWEITGRDLLAAYQSMLTRTHSRQRLWQPEEMAAAGRPKGTVKSV